MDCGASTMDAEEEEKEDRCMCTRKDIQTRRQNHDPEETGECRQAHWMVHRKKAVLGVLIEM